MRIGQFEAGGSEEPWAGVVLPDEAAVVSLPEAGAAAGVDLPRRTREVLATWEWQRKASLAVEYARETGDGRYDRDALVQTAPITGSGKVIGVGLNYEDHAEESGGEPPEEPVLFAKFPTALAGPGSTISWDPELAEQVDFEVELCTVVGRRARDVDAEEAREYVAGYAPGNDVSARDVQFGDDQWVRGKSLDGFAPIGPEIVTTDEVDDPHDLELWTDLNGERLQDSTTGNLIFDTDELVSFCSRAFTLLPGDVIYTGTPAGVGIFRDPPVLLEDGDTVTVGVEELGELTNYCAYE